MIAHDESTRPDLMALQLRHEIERFLSSAVADVKGVDGGGGMGSEDIWCRVGGVEFHIRIDWPQDAGGTS